MSEQKVVILINKELGMKTGKLAAQAAHAMRELLLHPIKPPKTPLKTYHEYKHEWFDDGTTTVVLYVKDVKEMMDVRWAAIEAGIALSSVIADAGRTEVPAGSFTACALGPAPLTQMDGVTGRLELV